MFDYHLVDLRWDRNAYVKGWQAVLLLQIPMSRKAIIRLRITELVAFTWILVGCVFLRQLDRQRYLRT